MKENDYISPKSVQFIWIFQIVSPSKVDQLSVVFKRIILAQKEEFFVQDIGVATVSDFEHLDQEDWDRVAHKIGKIPTRRLRKALQVRMEQVVLPIFLQTHFTYVSHTTPKNAANDHQIWYETVGGGSAPHKWQPPKGIN